MIWQGLQRLAAVGPIEGANIFQHWMWTFQGLVRFIQGATLPYGPGIGTDPQPGNPERANH
jgi:hypothetical protein